MKLKIHTDRTGGYNIQIYLDDAWHNISYRTYTTLEEASEALLNVNLGYTEAEIIEEVKRIKDNYDREMAKS